MVSQRKNVVFGWMRYTVFTGNVSGREKKDEQKKQIGSGADSQSEELSLLATKLLPNLSEDELLTDGFDDEQIFQQIEV